MITEDVWASLVKFTQDYITEMNDQGVLLDAQYIEWDAHASINDLPSTDLVGLTAFAVTVDENILRISAAIGIATMNEKNLFRLRKAAAHAFDKLMPMKAIALYNATTAIKADHMVVVDGTNLSPVTRADVRSVQFIQFEALLELS